MALLRSGALWMAVIGRELYLLYLQPTSSDLRIGSDNFENRITDGHFRQASYMALAGSARTVFHGVYFVVSKERTAVCSGVRFY